MVSTKEFLMFAIVSIITVLISEKIAIAFIMFATLIHVTNNARRHRMEDPSVVE
jgi:hypothetical protein